MTLDWKAIVLTIGIAAATSLATIAATIGLPPRTGGDVRAYLLAHPEVLPEAMAALDARDTGKAVAGNRKAIETPVGDAWMGNPNGDVTVVEFFDYNCGYCRASLPILAKLVAADPKVKVVFRELPILSQASYDAAKLSYAAARQGRFRAFHDPLYKAGPVSAATLTATARAAGVDVAKAKATDADADREIRANVQIARSLNFSGTPSWVVGDRAVSGLQPLEQLQAMVAAARAKR